MELQIRHATPADANAIATVHVASWEASYRGILADEEFEKRPLERRRRQWAECLKQRERITLVACDGSGDIKGFASAVLLEEGDFHSYLQTLYLLPGVKGRGLGRALLAAISKELLAAGARNMVLRTLRLNPARGFYERLGARFIPEGMELEAGTFDDVVYAFDDLGRLAELDQHPLSAFRM
jgi:ribosomal protein S18 acetylase RimI-like enzyme